MKLNAEGRRDIPWYQPETNSIERDFVLSVLDSGYLNEGEWTTRFENEIKSTVGSSYAVAVTSGTAAIALSLMAAGIGSGDEVIVPALTFIATANAVRLTGATVKLVDIEPHRFGLDPDLVKKSLSARTKAIVTVDINGRGAAYDFFEPFCKEKGLILICDSAEALGSSFRGRKLGTFGLAGAFSFSSNKTVTTGQGGMIVTNDRSLYERAVALKDQGRPRRGTGGNDLHPELGFNFKLTNLQAALGCGQMQKLAGRLDQAKLRDAIYRSAWAGIADLKFLDDSEAGEYRQWTDCLCEQPEKLEAILTGLHYGYRRFWFCLATQKPYQAGLENFSQAISVSKRGFWLASSFSLTENDIRSFGQHVVDAWKQG